MAYARFSRNQEVCLLIKKVYSTVWRIVPRDGNAKSKFGQPVRASDNIKLEHCATNHCLSNDHITYRNDFGDELEVSCLNAATMRKGQILANETEGTQVRENVVKATTDQNSWVFHLAENEEQAAPVETTAQYGAENVFADIRTVLAGAGSMGVRNFARALSTNAPAVISAPEL